MSSTSHDADRALHYPQGTLGARTTCPIDDIVEVRPR